MSLRDNRFLAGHFKLRHLEAGMKALWLSSMAAVGRTHSAGRVEKVKNPER